jgi:prolyl-tRNA editing enzyme YbaK/EbsC (Cys-tRNA(Pro) deacylase)
MPASDPRLNALRRLLEQHGCRFELSEQPENVHSAEAGAQHGIGSLEQMAPTFVLRAGDRFLAAIVSGATRLSYSKIKRELGLKDVSLASRDDVRAKTGSDVGWVCLIQPDLETIVDSRVAEQTVVFGGCGVPNHTLHLAPADLIRITRARVFDFTMPKEQG